MTKEKLYSILRQYISFEEKDVVYKSIKASDVSLKRIIEVSSTIGRIEVQNELENYCIVAVTKGSSAFSNASVVISIDKNQINFLSYAKEGLIKQNIARKNMEDIMSLLNGNTIPRRINMNYLIIFVIAMSLTFLIIGLLTRKPATIDKNTDIDANTFENNQISEVKGNNISEEPDEQVIRENLVSQYNTAISNLNTLAESYNEETKDLSLNNISSIPDSLPLFEKITIDSELSNNDISDKLIEYSQIINESISYYSIVHNLNSVNESAITNSLSGISNVVEYKAVTESNDPNGMLNKEGGYISAVYFTLDLIDYKSVPGNTVIDKGTDGGGCVELYANLTDAQSRCEYLKQFDNTLLYSGSYALVGRMVIRTSYQLSNQQQINVTESIVNNILYPATANS